MPTSIKEKKGKIGPVEVLGGKEGDKKAPVIVGVARAIEVLARVFEREVTVFSSHSSQKDVEKDAKDE